MQHEYEDRQEPEIQRGMGRDRDEDRGRWSRPREFYEGRGYGERRGYDESRREPSGGYESRRGASRFESDERDYGGRWEGRSGQRDIGQRLPRGEYGFEEYGGGHGSMSHSRGWQQSQSYGGGYSNIFDEERGRRGQARSDEGRSFRGTGPKGYSRSDESIRDDVSERLTEAADLDPSEMTVEVNAGEVTLAGSVDSRWAKRYCEDLAYGVRGVKNVQNQLRIEGRAERETQPRARTEQGNGQRRARASSLGSESQTQTQQQGGL